MTIRSLYPDSEPSISLDFVNRESLDGRINFTRTSTGTYIGSDGLIKTAGRNVPRFDRDPLTGDSLGLLVEEARTNLVLRSAELDNAAWTKTRTTVTANAVTSPDGATTADKLTEDAVSQNHSFGQSSIPTVAGTVYTASIYIKAGERYRGQFQLAGAFPTQTVAFNLQTLALTVVTGSPASYLLVNVGNGWFRLSMTASATSTLAQFNFYLYDNSGNGDYVGDGTSGLYVWGMQFEASSFPTSYISTTTATVTRAADSASILNNNIYSKDNFTIISQPFGSATGSNSLNLIGPTIKQALVYSENLPQVQINGVARNNDGFWRWRVLGSSFALPTFTTNGTVTVDWGDGVIETLNNSVHTFTNGGGYHDIGFRLNSGTFFKPNINGNATYGPRVIALGPAPTSMKLNGNVSFSGCTALKSFDATVDVTGSTDLGVAWANCSSLSSFPLINTGSVVAFNSTWSGCLGLTSFPLINTGAGTNFQSAWQNCTNLTSFPLINTSAGTNFQLAWSDCSSLTSFPLITTSSGTNFAQAWQRTGLTSFPSLNFSSATTFEVAWYQCLNLATFPANIFNTTGTLVSVAFNSAFFNCALTATSIENILTSLVTNGRSNITLGLNGGTNANASTWSATANNAYATLVNRGWTITQNGTPPYSAVTLLLHGDGTNGSTTITDNSSATKTVTAFGNAQISTAQSKFGGASIAFDGNGDYLTAPHSTSLNLSPGDFTIEAWVYHVARPSSSNQIIIGKDGVAGSSFSSYSIYASSTGEFFAAIGNGTGTSPTETAYTFGTVSLATWTHVALVRSGTTIRTFLNGTAVTTQTQGIAMTDGGKNLFIGYYQGGGAANYFNGYIDDLRITKGLAVYTANFTPPTAAFPNP